MAKVTITITVDSGEQAVLTVDTSGDGLRVTRRQEVVDGDCGRRLADIDVLLLLDALLPEFPGVPAPVPEPERPARAAESWSCWPSGPRRGATRWDLHVPTGRWGGPRSSTLRHHTAQRRTGELPAGAETQPRSRA